MKLVLHPFLFTFAAVLFIYMRASAYVPPDHLVRSLLILWIMLAVLAFPLYRLIHNWMRIGFVLAFLAISFYSPFDFFVFQCIALSVIFIGWRIYFSVKKRKMDERRVTIALNFISALLVLIELYFIGKDLSATKLQVYKTMLKANTQPASVELTNPSSRPDIYYIILDGYGRADILQKYYGFDDSDFIGYLRGKAFLIPAENHSNYPRTVSSVTSTLNMDYLHALEPDLGSSTFWWTTIPLLDNNVVMNSLRDIGYRIIVIDTSWSITNIRTADEYYRPYPVMLSDFESYLLDVTPLGIFEPVMQRFASVNTDETHQTVVQFHFDTLASLPESPDPKFVFAHILSPHPPSANEFHGTDAEYKRDHIEQLEYANAQIEKTVDAILQNSDVPPIIILQADHGPGMLTDFNHMETACLEERFSPLAAYYLPGVLAEDLPDDITPVNLFRFIFNQYFDANLPMLENKEYSFRDPRYIFEPVDVTGRVDETCSVDLLGK